MKKTKIIIPALGMLLLSTAASVTGTVAWFSANSQVSATGLQIQAKSNETFLLISSSSTTAAAIQAENSNKGNVSVAFTMAQGESQVFPSKPIESSEVGEGKLFAANTTYVSDATTAAVASNWYTATNNDPTAATGGTVTPTALTAFTNYVIKRSVYITLAAGSVSAHSLSATATVAKQGESGTVFESASVLVATGSNFAILKESNSWSGSLSTTDFTITDSAATQIDIYVYVDGSHDDVFTNNMANLAAASVDLRFNVEVGSAS